MSVQSEEVLRPIPGIGEPDVSQLSTRQLLSQIAQDGRDLIIKEIDLARSELKADIRTELASVKALGVAAVLALCGVTLLLVTAALGLAEVMPAWAAGLIVSGVVLAAAGIFAAFGWSRRLRQPLGTTRQSLVEGLRWVKEHRP